MFNVSAKFKKKSRLWLLRKVLFWLFWGVIDPETPPGGATRISRKIRSVTFFIYIMFKVCAIFFQIQGVVIEKIAILDSD